MHHGHWFCLLYTRDNKNWKKLDCKTVGFFFSKSVNKTEKSGVRVLRARSARASHVRRACEAREIKNVSPQFCSLFSASFQTFCLTARAYLNTQKYGLFCSLQRSQDSQLGVCVLLLVLLRCLSLWRFIETAKKNQQCVGPLKWESGAKVKRCCLILFFELEQCL